MIFVDTLCEAERVTLESMHKNHPSHATRVRAHAILLSHWGYSIQAIADVHMVCRQTVSSWINHWETQGLVGLIDKPRSGRPRVLSEVQEQVVIEAVKKQPRKLKQVASELSEQFGINVTVSKLKRLCKQAGYSWTRIHQSLRSKRDQRQFDEARHRIEELIAQEDNGEIDLYFFDESGFTLTPCVPYAWQPKGKQPIELRCAQSKRLNVLGFVNRRRHFESFVFEGTVDSVVVVGCFEAFSKTLDKDVVIVLDNAPVDRSEEFMENIETWEQRGLYIKFLPPYCPELNIIEIVWRKIKYEWIPFSAYESFGNLKNKLFNILKDIGEN
ncbi:MAG: IS630 family transposase [Gammaproteobacteria bacterium]